MHSYNDQLRFGLAKGLGFMLLAGLFLFTIVFPLSAQTTGKISGQVKDSNGEPLIGVNIILEDTELGAATDTDGFYVILNVRAGTYTMRFFYIGYQTRVVENVRVSADKTTRIDAVLAQEAVAGQEVVVTAQKPLVEFNLTSSIASVNSQEIRLLPVQTLDEIVNLQAGVVDGHFRGGRLGEVQYQVDGVSVNNPYDNSSTLRLDRSVIEEVQVISGTFDAKYGQAMSGVVNTVLKSGSERFEWSGEVYGGDYYTTDTDRYPNNDALNPARIQNYQLTLSGPLPLSKTTFLISGRRFMNNGYLYGERRFLPTDKNNFESGEKYPSGDRATVDMQWSKEWSGQFKLTNRAIKNLQISYQAILNDIEGQNYNHAFRLNPEGIKTQSTFSVSHGLDWTHTLSDKMFYKINLRQNYFDYTDFTYENLYDPRYLEAGEPKGDPNYQYGAVIQGVDLGRFKQQTNSGIFKGDFTLQATRNHLLETGIEVQVSEVSFGSPGYIRPTTVNGVQVLLPRESIPGEPGVQTYKPRQGALYLQDRVEWGDFVLRAGLRYDYFDARATVPGDLKNPANAIQGAPVSLPRNTGVKSSLSPRIGFSYPLSSSSSLYFSYGHFSQMPGLANLYSNADYSVLKELQANSIDYGVMGNPDLGPEKTIQYEFGLKQAVTDYVGLEITLFSKDIRDLLGVEFVTTYNVADYARFTNVDFGNVYGFTISLDQRPIGLISTTVDYTLQVARGNSSNPRETAIRAQGGKDPRPRDIPFDWDQLHTLNATAVLAKPGNYSLSTILKLGSGQPYTPQIGSGFGADLETNSGRKSSFILVDLRAEKFFRIKFAQLGAFIRVFNLFNTHFVNGFVFSTTGSPDYTQFPSVNQAQLLDPGRFYPPRRVEIGLSLLGR